MIFATAQLLEDYDVIINGVKVGIYTTYFNRSPVLFNLITRASLVPFQFEPMNDGKTKFFIIEDDHLYEQTLKQKVGGITVDRLCVDLSPLKMLEFFQHRPADLPPLGITKYWHGDVDLVLDVMRARALQWKKHQRGTLSRDGNVIQGRFGTLLERGEESFLLKMNPYHKDFKDPVEVVG